MQSKQSEWHEQWSMMSDNELSLFQDWIKPHTMEVFKGKTVLECGCGGGQHTAFVAPQASHITAIDLNTTDIAKKRNSNNNNVTFIEADIAGMNLGRTFDVVFSIGVIHHTDNPDETFRAMVRHCAPGGVVIIWVYSREGNLLVRSIVEPIRKMFLRRMNRKALSLLAKVITMLLYVPVYSFYLLPVRGLPYYLYFKNFRKLSFARNVLNVFDKLNAPQVDFISKRRIHKWFSSGEFESYDISSYLGVSWRGTGIKR